MKPERLPEVTGAVDRLIELYRAVIRELNVVNVVKLGYELTFIYFPIFHLGLLPECKATSCFQVSRMILTLNLDRSRWPSNNLLWM